MLRAFLSARPLTRRLALAGLAATPLLVTASGLTLTEFSDGTVASAGDMNANFAELEAAVEALQTAQHVPAGAVMHFVSAQCPAGWIKADGQTHSSATYPALATALGAGSNFVAPDLRGEFIRGFDDGRGVDSGRTLRSAQADMFKNHTHNLPLGGDGFTAGHMPQRTANHNDNGVTGTSPTGGTETRPRNVALLACIKT